MATRLEVGYEGEEPELVIDIPLREDQTMLANPEVVQTVFSTLDAVRR